MNFIISTYPLSGQFRRKIETKIGPNLNFNTLSELRQFGFFQMGKYLLSINCSNVVIAIEDESSSVLIPTLKLLGALPSARSRLILTGQDELSIFNRLDALVAACGVLIASIVAILYTFVFDQQVKFLKRMSRVEVDGHGSGAFYLNANLWFGVKAGGSVGHISGVANAFIERGIDLVFASVGGRLMVSKKARFLDLKPPKFLTVPFETTYYRFNASSTSQCFPALQMQKPQFIYQRMSLANISGVLLSRRYKLPLIIEYNGSEVWVAKNWGKALRYHNIAARGEEVCLQHAHLIVTISDVLRKELIGRGVDESRIVVYPNCIDPILFNPERFSQKNSLELRSRYGIPNDAVLATFVGTFGEWHGTERFAEAALKIISERLNDAKSSHLYFLFVGDGLKMSNVKHILAPVLSTGRVVISGLIPQEEAPAYLAASDILVSPHIQNLDGSEFFGSPTKLFEYMAMGKAILASDLAQIGEVLQPSILCDKAEFSLENLDSAAAVLCPPGDVQALINGLKYLANNPDARNKLGGNARALALEKYTWEHHVKKILSSFESL